MSEPTNIIKRVSQILSTLPFVQSPEGYRAILISAGLTDLLRQIDFYGKAPDAFWTNLIWELWQSSKTDSIDSILITAKERVGTDIGKNIDLLLEDLKFISGQRKGSIFRGELWNSLPEGTETTIEAIRDKARLFLLKHTSTYCSDYLQHSLDHSDRSIAILNNWLFDDEQKQYFKKNEWMVFFLYASLYLHDIGLCIPPDSEEKICKISSRGNLKETYDERGAMIIRNYWKELGIESSFQADILSRLCLWQKKQSLESKQLQIKIPYLQTGKHINLQILVSCLRLVNEFDLTPERMSFLLEQFVSSDLVLESDQFSLGGVGPHAGFIDTITLYIQCFNIDLHKALKQHEGYAQNLLNEVNRNISPRFRFTQVIYEIENIGYESIDFRFRVDTSAALEIFVGNPIYTNRATFLRELIQNSIDACDVKRLNEPSFTPDISVIMGHNSRSVVVADNGIGMNKSWVEKYFLPVGISFYRSEEFENLNSIDVGFTPISKFGVGILSCFMVAKKIIIRTKKQGSVGLEMEISDYRNYFSIRFDDGVKEGTEITVHFNAEIKDIDCLGYLLDIIKCTKYPIKYIYYNGESRILSQSPISLVGGLKQQFWSKEWENYIEEPILLADSEGYIAFKVERPANLLFLPGDMSTCEVHIFQDGLYICNEMSLLPKWITSNIIANLNLTNTARVDLSISRIGILHNSKYNLLRNNIKTGLISLLTKMFEELRSYYSELADYKETFSAFIDKSLNVESDNDLLDLLRSYYCYTLYTKEGEVFGYYFLDDLVDIGRLAPIRHQKELLSRRSEDFAGNDTYFIMRRDAYVLFLLYKRKRSQWKEIDNYEYTSSGRDFWTSYLTIKHKTISRRPPTFLT